MSALHLLLYTNCTLLTDRPNVWIVNNTIAYNKGYGLAVKANVVSSESLYRFRNLFIYNNIFAMNTGKIRITDPETGEILDSSDIQVLLQDFLSNSTDDRGFMCSLELDYNCYYNGKGSEVISIVGAELSVAALSLQVFKDLGCSSKTAGPFGSNSIQTDPDFGKDVLELHIQPGSPCEDSATVVALEHYEFLGQSVSESYDFVHQEIMSLETPESPIPDIGAYEIQKLDYDI